MQGEKKFYLCNVSINMNKFKYFLCGSFRWLIAFFKKYNYIITQKIKNKFASLISKFLYKGLKEELLPNGHTVLVVFDKK